MGYANPMACVLLGMHHLRESMLSKTYTDTYSQTYTDVYSYMYIIIYLYISYLLVSRIQVMIYFMCSHILPLIIFYHKKSLKINI